MDLQSANFWRSSLAAAADACTPAIRIMEVCGTHTNAIAQHHLRKLLPENVKLISGPGCPVCVSGVLFIEKVRTLLNKNITVAMFGDLLRIPGTHGSLMGEKNLKIVYSPDDALTFAQENPQREVVFAAVGFAPTLSATAALMSACVESRVKNFSLLADFKELSPVLDMLISSRNIDGFLLPGHVASVVGSDYFKNLNVPGVVAGFDAENILHSLKMLLEAVKNGDNKFLCNNYPQAVRNAGNPVAMELINNYFELATSIWRGLGEVKGGGWQLKNNFAEFNAEIRYDLSAVSAQENPACRCGDVLTGLIEPQSCPLFGKYCTPSAPAGACMSSGEGACAAAFNFQE